MSEFHNHFLEIEHFPNDFSQKLCKTQSRSGATSLANFSKTIPWKMSFVDNKNCTVSSHRILPLLGKHDARCST